MIRIHSVAVIVIFIFITQGCNKDSSNPIQPPNTIANKVVYGGQIYNTVKIGNQIWLKENMNIGTMIPGSQSQTNNNAIQKYCYNDDTANCTKYGGLYQWDEAMQYVTSEGAKGICPPDWHIPSINELQLLASAVNNDNNSLKAEGVGSGSGTGTNTSGFSAMLGGTRSSDATFYSLNIYTNFWSSSADMTEAAEDMFFMGDDSSINYWRYGKDMGLSIRCLKD